MPNEGLYQRLYAKVEPMKRGPDRVDERDKVRVAALTAEINAAAGDIGWAAYQKLYNLLHLASSGGND